MNNKNKIKQVDEQRKKARQQEKLFYHDVQFTSRFEVEVAKYLDQLKIEWKRNEQAFPAVMEDGKILHYIPDFLLLDYNIYIESKGKFWDIKKKNKMFNAVDQNKLNFIIIMLREWKKSKRILRLKIQDKIREVDGQSNWKEV